MTAKAQTGSQKLQLRTTGAIFRLPDFELIEVSGKDAERFLHSQTSNDIKSLTDGDGHMSALLDRKAHVLALFDVFRSSDSYYILAANHQADSIISQLDAFRFADKVDFEKRPGKCFSIQGPRAQRLLLSSGVKTAQELNRKVLKIDLLATDAIIFSKTLTGEEGFIVLVDEADSERFYERLKTAASALDMIELEESSAAVARIEAGIAAFGEDLTSDNLMPETGLDHSHVSYTKGCFLGQEVLARVKSHGAPSRGLVGLVFQGLNGKAIPAPFANATEVEHEGQTIAWIQSNAYSEVFKNHVAMAYVKREFRVVGKRLAVTIQGKPYEVEINILPLISPPTPAQRAKALYEEALCVFTKEKDDDKNSQAESLLREALLLDPSSEDIYESLGVILSRKDQLDEAILLMNSLAELNPDSVMAHANLSVFYMQKGLIEKAEEEKALSMSIRMRMAAKEATRERQEKEEKEKQKEEATGRMDMFSQVLEIDSEDLLANSGMGNCLVVLEQFEKALPFLQKAIEVKPTHTVAYVDLAKAFTGLKRKADAVLTLEKGIEVASKRGDMMPLKQMQLQLKELG